MLQMELEPKKVGIRDFQHNFASHYAVAKKRPLVITKYGKDQLVVADPDIYELKERKKPNNTITRDLEFFGMHKNRKDWKGKSTAQILAKLRRAAWGEQ